MFVISIVGGPRVFFPKQKPSEVYILFFLRKKKTKKKQRVTKWSQSHYITLPLTGSLETFYHKFE